MAAVLRCTTLAIRTDPLEAPTPQTVAPWEEVLAFLQHVATLAEAGTAFSWSDARRSGLASSPTLLPHR